MTEEKTTFRQALREYSAPVLEILEIMQLSILDDLSATGTFDDFTEGGDL